MVLFGCVLPVLAMALFAVAICFFRLNLLRGRHRAAAFAVLAAFVCAVTAWDLLDMAEVIAAAMLLYCGGLGLLTGGWAWGYGKQRSVVGPVLAAFTGAVIPCLGFLFVTLPYRMWDEVQWQVRSPDGAYTATLAYYDGLTFGYQRITVRRNGWFLPGGSAEITEVASEGLERMSWSGNRTLVIDYDGSRHKDALEDTEFVEQDKRWRDVEIVYRNVPQ